MPPPSPGDINQTASAAPVSSASPVPLQSTGNFGGKVTVKLTSIKRITTTAEGPGEVAGPGVSITIQITNASAKAVDLTSVIADLQNSSGVSATEIATTAKPFSGTLAAGKNATGIYVYTLPKGSSGAVTFNVTFSAGAPVVVFTGPLP